MLVLFLAPGLELVLGLVREETKTSRKSIEWHAPCFGECSVAFDIQLPHEKLASVSARSPGADVAKQLQRSTSRGRLLNAIWTHEPEKSGQV